MARRGYQSTMTNNGISNFNEPNEITQQRISVFDRLGPSISNQNVSKTQSAAPKENNYPDRRQEGGGAHDKQHQQNPPRERPRNSNRDPSTAQTPGHHQVHIKPNALLHRTLQDVKKERTIEALVANPVAAIEYFEQRLQRAEDDRIAAEELPNALLLTQQTLLQDKAKLQAENMQLKREMDALKERIEYLNVSGEHCSPAPLPGASGEELRAREYAEYHGRDVDDTYAADRHHYQAITPDSGMLRALKMNAAAGSGDVDGEKALAHLKDLGDVAKKLEVNI
jgi:hypothetical protein